MRRDYEDDAKELVNQNMGDHAKKFPVVLVDEDMLVRNMAFHKWFAEYTYGIDWVFKQVSGEYLAITESKTRTNVPFLLQT